MLKAKSVEIHAGAMKMKRATSSVRRGGNGKIKLGKIKNQADDVYLHNNRPLF